MIKLRRISKRILAFIITLIVVVASTPFSKPYEVQAFQFTPFPIPGGGTGVMEAYLLWTALQELGGIAYEDAVTNYNAYKTWAYRNPEAHEKLVYHTRKRIFDDYNNPVYVPYEVGETVSLSIGGLKEFFGYSVDFYKGLFNPAAVETGSYDNFAISTTNTDYKLYYFRGFPIIDIYGNDYSNFGEGGISQSRYAELLDKFNTIYVANSVGRSFTFDGFNYESVVSVVEGDNMLHRDRVVHRDGVTILNNRSNFVFATSGLRRILIPFVDVNYLRFDQMNSRTFRLQINNAAMGATSNHLGTSGRYGIETGQMGFLKNDYPVSELFEPSFTASVNPAANIMQDTDDYYGTTEAIRTAINDKIASTADSVAKPIDRPFEDDDEIGIILNPPGDIGLSLGDWVTSFPKETDIPGIDVPDVGNPSIPDVDNPAIDMPTDIPVDIPAVDVPVVEAPDISWDWSLSGFLDAIIKWLMSIWNAITSIPAAIADILIGTGTISFEGLTMSADELTAVFPFSIPFDFIDAVSSLMVTPQAPVYEMDFSSIPYFYGYRWRLDMSEYESLAAIVRWVVWISVLVGLIANTNRFIKW